VKLDSMEALYLAQLRDMHNAEKQLIAALPKMVKAASTPELAEAFERHLEETRRHLERINTILDNLGEKPGRDRCEAMAGLIEECKETIDAQGEEHVRDASLIVHAQKVEHYEIASYGSLCTHAKLLGRTTDQKLLGDTLSEEKQTDGRLTQLAESHINADAARVSSAHH
jgi:ferritin-like metal-binding protein YciE